MDRLNNNSIQNNSNSAVPDFDLQINQSTNRTEAAESRTNSDPMLSTPADRVGISMSQVVSNRLFLSVEAPLQNSFNTHLNAMLSISASPSLGHHSYLPQIQYSENEPISVRIGSDARLGQVPQHSLSQHNTQILDWLPMTANPVFETEHTRPHELSQSEISHLNNQLSNESTSSILNSGRDSLAFQALHRGGLALDLFAGPTRQSLVFEHGQEAKILAAFLRNHPQQGIFAIYTNAGEQQVGIDEGGLSRQVLTLAYQAMINPDSSKLFTGNTSGLTINTKDFDSGVSAEIDQALEVEARDLGLLLGCIHRTDVVVSNLFERTEMNKILAAYGAIMQDPALKFDDPGGFRSHIQALSLEAQVNLILAIKPELAQNAHYLRQLEPEDLRSYLELLIPYIEIASGFAASKKNPDISEDKTSILDKIFGVQDLKAAMISQAKLTSGRMSVGTQQLRETVNHWLKQAISNMDAGECENLCFRITGANSLGIGDTGQIKFSLNNAMQDWEPYKERTCFMQLDLNLKVIAAFVALGAEEGFKRFEQLLKQPASNEFSYL